MTYSEIQSHRPSFLAHPFAGGQGADVDTIASESDSDAVVNLAKGFPAAFSRRRADGGQSIRRRDLNGILNLISQFGYYFQFMGRNPWMSGISYPKWAKVFHDGKEWVSRDENNTSTPGSEIGTWDE